MSENWAIAIFVAVLTGAGGIIGSVVAAYVALIWRMTKYQNEADSRLVRLETQFEDWLKKWAVLAANVMHDDENRHGQDNAIDKFLDFYKKNHDMSAANWVEFYQTCQRVIDNPATPSDKRAFAEFAKEVCVHKIQRDGTLDLIGLKNV